jgi:hypothetical protein
VGWKVPFFSSSFLDIFAGSPTLRVSRVSPVFFSIPVFWILSSLLFLIRSEICREWSVRWSRPPLECTIFFRWFQKKAPLNERTNATRGGLILLDAICLSTFLC